MFCWKDHKICNTTHNISFFTRNDTLKFVSSDLQHPVFASFPDIQHSDRFVKMSYFNKFEICIRFCMTNTYEF